jgi:proline iminopeptidase
MTRTHHGLRTCIAFGAIVQACHAAGRATQAGIPQQASSTGYVVTRDSARLYYRVVGKGRDTIIAIHGGPGVDLESIAGDFAPLTAKHTVIFYDQRGTGRSDLPSDTLKLGAQQQIDDLDAVRQRFRLERVTLVAHSYGPLLAATYALAHPEHVSRMVFFGPVPPRRGDFWTRFGTAMGSRLDSSMQARLAAAGRKLFDPASDTATIRSACREYWAIALQPRLADAAHGAEKLHSDLCGSDPRGIRYGLMTTNRVVMASYGDWDLRARLKSLAVPTLVVHGEAEAIPLDLVEEWVTSMPHAELFRVPNAAHFTYAERPDIVWPAVEAFLGRRF